MTKFISYLCHISIGFQSPDASKGVSKAVEADVFADADDITRLPEVPAVLPYSGVLIRMTEDSVPNLIQ